MASSRSLESAPSMVKITSLRRSSRFKSSLCLIPLCARNFASSSTCGGNSGVTPFRLRIASQQAAARVACPKLFTTLARRSRCPCPLFVIFAVTLSPSATPLTLPSSRKSKLPMSSGVMNGPPLVKCAIPVNSTSPASIKEITSPSGRFPRVCFESRIITLSPASAPFSLLPRVNTSSFCSNRSANP